MQKNEQMFYNNSNIKRKGLKILMGKESTLITYNSAKQNAENQDLVNKIDNDFINGFIDGMSFFNKDNQKEICKNKISTLDNIKVLM